MSTTPARKLGLTDLMMLIAAVALGLWLNRMGKDYLEYLIFPIYGRAKDTVLGGLGLALPHLATLSLASLAISLRRPRPGLTALAARPGSLACAVASLGVAALICWFAANAAAGRQALSIQEMVATAGSGRSASSSGPLWPLALPTFGDRVGFAVGGAWFSQWVLGRWLPERSWIDRLGRLVGCAWLLATAVIWLRPFLI